MKTDKFTFGIIGAGLMGKRRAESLMRFPESKLVSVADVDKENAENLAKKYGCKWTNSYLDILNDSGVNCIIVSVINNKLYEITKKAIKSGKHVFVEKPVATNPEEISELVDLSKNNNVIVKVGFNHRFLPAIIKAKELFYNNEIGELMFIKSTYGQKSRIGFEKEWRSKKNLSGGGELLDQGVHVIDLCHLFMKNIIDVGGIISNLFWKSNVDDNDFFYIKDEDDKIAFIHTSSSLWRNTFQFHIHGTKGIIEIEGLRGHYGLPKLKLLKRNDEKSKEVGVYQFDEKVFNFSDEELTFISEMENFLNAIKEKEEINGDLIDAKNTLTVVFDLYGKRMEE